MSGNFEFGSSMQPLSIGNVVSAAARLYRSHFKQYLGLALKSILWGLIPIYGWAKFCAIQAIIARLAFRELVNQPEGVKAARHVINPRLWNFWLVQIIVALILFGVNIGISIVRGIISGIFAVALGDNSVITSLIIFILSLIGLVAYLWVYARVFIPELPLAVEDILDPGQAISRSWELTKGYEWRLQAIILIASLITFPLIAVAAIPFIVAMGYFFASIFANPGNGPGSDAVATFLLLIFAGIILMLIVNILMTPFWQAIKAVVYFDLKSRREGLGLNLGDREI